MISTRPNYTDLPFFLSKNAFTGDLNTVKDLSAIRQALKNLVMSDNGERPFNYDFGCGFYKTIFENYTMELMMDIQQKVSSNIRMFEQRVIINNIRVVDAPKQNAINVYIDFGLPDVNIQDTISIALTRTR
jgi:phage baseplate assembly protein W